MRIRVPLVPQDQRRRHNWSGRNRFSRFSSACSVPPFHLIYFSGKPRRKWNRSALSGAAVLARAEAPRQAELRKAFIDVVTGMFFSNLAMYFIILTTSATLNAHGLTGIETARQAAEALRPLAGNGAYWLFTLGLIGTGILVLAGSSAYAIGEALAWRASLNLAAATRPEIL